MRGTYALFPFTAGKIFRYGALWNRLVKIVCQQLAVPEYYVTEDAHFVKDLGAD